LENTLEFIGENNVDYSLWWQIPMPIIRVDRRW